MKFEGIEKINCGNYLNRYDVSYRTPSGHRKVYEMFSRDGSIDSEEKLQNPRTDAVIIIATDASREHLLLIREFRLELDRCIYGLPAGLIDPGESVEETAKRELKEETGLTLTEIRDVMPASYCAVGLSNEQCVCVFCTAEGQVASHTQTGEEITARWYTKAELSELVRRETFGSWAQAYTYMWTKGF